MGHARRAESRAAPITHRLERPSQTNARKDDARHGVHINTTGYRDNTTFSSPNHKSCRRCASCIPTGSSLHTGGVPIRTGASSMGDYHRIHPVAVGSPPPEQASRGKKPSHEQLQLPVTAPAPGAPAPLPPPPRRKRHSRCCRCVCCTLLAVLLLAVALAATAGILYLVFRPKIPNFRVDRLTVTRFDVNATTMTVTDAFDVDVTATNPNKRIGIYYDGGEVTASFNGTQLCRGDFPTLYQGHRTTVQPRVTLAGETRLDSAVVAQLAQQRQAGFVPLTVRARVPIRIKFGAIKLWKMTGKADCNLMVDNLQAGTQLRIRSNSCSFKLKI